MLAKKASLQVSQSFAENFGTADCFIIDDCSIRVSRYFPVLYKFFHYGK